MSQNIVNEIFLKIYRGIGNKWRRFLKEIGNEAETEDKVEIQIEHLVRILKKFGVVVSEYEKESILDTYPGWDEG